MLSSSVDLSQVRRLEELAFAGWPALESRDVAAVCNLVRERWPNEPDAALGISMGAAAICFAAAETNRCQAVILESCYRDIASAFQNRLRHGYPP